MIILCFSSFWNQLCTLLDTTEFQLWWKESIYEYMVDNRVCILTLFIPKKLRCICNNGKKKVYCLKCNEKFLKHLAFYLFLHNNVFWSEIWILSAKTVITKHTDTVLNSWEIAYTHHSLWEADCTVYNYLRLKFWIYHSLSFAITQNRWLVHYLFK